MQKQIIFIGGIHGVGKTTITNKLTELLDIKAYVCGDLIKKMDAHILNKNSKNVKNISSTQNLLLEGIDKIVKETNIILDGHFCLLNKAGNIGKIPVYVFEQLNIRTLIVVYRDANEIINSLLKRDDKQYNYHEINLFQETEISYASELANLLNINLIKHNANEPIQNLYNKIKLA